MDIEIRYFINSAVVWLDLPDWVLCQLLFNSTATRIVISLVNEAVFTLRRFFLYRSLV